MAPKPFGKPGSRKRPLPVAARGALIAFAAAPVLAAACHLPAARYRLLETRGLFWPSVAVLGACYAVAAYLWLRRRPSPRGPWDRGRIRRFLAHGILALLLASPASLVSAWLYQPPLTLLNGMLGQAPGTLTYALVESGPDARAVLRSPYWRDDVSYELTEEAHKLKARGSLAVLKIARGALGAWWVADIEFRELP